MFKRFLPPVLMTHQEEVARVCSGVLLQDVYQDLFESCMIPKSLKSGIILPYSKAKGPKPTIRIITEE